MNDSELRTLGTFEFTIDGRAVARPSTQKARALLAYLAMRCGESVAREAIVETFWPEADPDNARQSLKTALWSIRRCLRDAGVDPAEVVTGDNFTLCWRAATVVDASAFERRARAGDLAAIDTYAGDFLPGDYDVWASAQRERLINLLESLLTKALAGEGGVAAAQRLLQIDPFNEAAYATLIDAEVRANRIVAAQTLLQRLRRLLQENGLEASRAFDERFSDVETVKSDGLRGRFIGRTRELTLFDRSLRSDEAGIFIVHADAGFGKTALLEQFFRRAAEAGRTTVSFSAAHLPHGFGGWENVYLERTRRPFEKLVAERGASLAVAMAQAIVATLPRGSYIFVDDALNLQGDAAFATSAVAVKAREAGVSLVFATRPEGVRGLLGIVGGETVDVPLSALSEEEIQLALAERGAQAHDLAKLLYARTHGHPLFLQRIMDRGIDGKGDYYLPASVRALVDARLHERGDDAHTVGAMLALDADFGSDELGAILRWPEERVLDAIDDLLALGIVRESEGAAHLQFAHDLVREIARDSLSPQRRRRLHRQAAEVLTGATALSEIARCAQHRSAAGEAVLAAQLFLRCSEAAFAVFEPRNAAVLARRASDELRKLDRTPEIERLSLQIDAARIRALSAASDLNGAEQIARMALAAAERLGDARLLFEVLLLRMRSRMRTSNLDGIEQDARRALGIAEELGDRRCIAEACLGLLQVSRQRANEEETVKYAKLALDAAIESEDADLAVFIASECLHAQALSWRFAEGAETLRRGDELLERASGATEPNFHYSAAMLMYMLDRYREADERVDRALQLLDDLPLVSGRFIPDRQRIVGILLHMRGLIAVARGQWQRAYDSAQAFGENPAARAPGLYPHVVDLSVRALLGRSAPGDVERAAALLATIDESTLVEDTTMYVHCARARIAARLGDPRAAALLDESLSLVERTCAGVRFDADRLFGDLAQSAEECAAAPQAARARALSGRFSAERLLPI